MDNKGAAWCRILSWVLGVTLAGIPYAAPGFGGSVSGLMFQTRSARNGEEFQAIRERLRLRVSKRFSDFDFRLIYDLDAWQGSFLDSPEYAQLRAAPDPYYWSLQGVTDETRDWVVAQGVYRVTASWASPLGDFRLGRQQVNWAQTWLWSPIDQINPVSPLQLEPDERPGVDALLWDASDLASGRLSIVHVPAHDASAQTTAVRWLRTLNQADFSLMAGKFRSDTRLGLGTVWARRGTGVRLETVWASPENGNSYWQSVINLNRAFASGFNVALEYFSNGNPEAAPLLLPAPATTLRYAGRHYLGLLLWQDVTAFWRYRVTILRNLSDRSWVVYPRVTVTLPGQMETYVSLGLQRPDGPGRSEFGSMHSLGLIQAEVWF